MTKFRTDIVFTCGICAGLSENAKLGQMLVASPAWEYQAGKWSKNGFEIAPDQLSPDPITQAIIDHRIMQSGFQTSLEVDLDPKMERPSVRSVPKLAPVATGSAVVADEKRLGHIEQQHRKVAGIDMETYGIYFSARHALNAPLHIFSVKVVVDLADEGKSNNLHYYGCHVSSRAALLLSKALVDNRGNMV